MKQMARDIIDSAIVFLVVSWLLCLAYSYIVAHRQILEYGERQELIPNVVKAGQLVSLCRDFEVLRETEYEVTRSLIKSTSADGFDNVSFGQSTALRKKGKLSQCRKLILPNTLTPGEWEIHTHIRADFFVWTHIEVAPVVKFTVIQ